ncbi:MAG: YjjG family noncanonical pyrimidine nucleotidase [Clostridia bacterium]|nr:YjjG family noncanonical pyrimidine nucleotidase [Clostridia bacterium]
MKFTTILMDADDTIFDFPKCEYFALKESIEDFDLNFSEEVYNHFSSINAALWRKFEINKITRSELKVQRFRELVRQCFAGFERSDQMAEKYVEALSGQAILLDGAFEALESLSESYAIYIITNGLKPVQRGRFSRTDITKFIKKLYISDEIGTQKPNKAYFDYVLSDIPEKDLPKILVVGDSLTSDMQGGRNAGLTTCLFDPKNRIEMPNDLCDYKITSLMEIFDIDKDDKNEIYGFAGA